MLVDRFLNQKRSPACTAISFFTTLFVWVAMIVLYGLRGNGWNALASFAMTALVVALGALVNIVAGFTATARSEYYGGVVACCGLALWTVTGFVLWLLR
jgi:hypothetical protein